MDRATRQRLVGIHVAFSDAIGTELERLWKRRMTAEEKNIVADSTVCLSFMMLESAADELSSSDSSERADEGFTFLRSQVEARRDLAIREISEGARSFFRKAPSAEQFSNLIEWEKAILSL